MMEEDLYEAGLSQKQIQKLQDDTVLGIEAVPWKPFPIACQ